MFKHSITFALLALIFVPTTSFAYTAKGSELGMGYVFDIGLENKPKQAVFMYAPKGWDFLDRAEAGIYFSKNDVGSEVGSVTFEEISTDPSNYNRSLFNPKGKSKAWFVKNYVAKNNSYEGVEDVIHKRIKIDGVTAEYYRYEKDGATLGDVMFTKFDKVFYVHFVVDTPKWKEHENAIRQSIGSISARKLGLEFK
jgi:hypothetical protein